MSERSDRVAEVRAELTARMREAWNYGEGSGVGPVSDRKQPLAVLIALVTAMSLIVALIATPGVAVVTRTMRGIAQRFSGPISEVALPNVAQRSVVLDRSGRVLATLSGEEDRVIVPLKRIPKHTRDAVLAIEDAKFYTHKGVDPTGLMRALLSNVRSGSLVQGGSTITQQLVKNTLVGSERSLDRKILEARLAVRLEQEMTKDEILEAYLNEAYFGNGMYGVGTASEFYFGRKVEDLSIPQSALLAAVIKAPTDLEPLKNPKRAKARRAIVVRRMLSEGFISQKQARNANLAGLGAKAHPTPSAETPYFVEHIKQQLFGDERLGATREERITAVFKAGLRITTTLDLRQQQRADEAVRGVLDAKSDPQAALVSIDPPTGQLRAVIGGRDFDNAKFDLATQGQRQPGSTFKAVALVAALRDGFGPSLTFDTPSPYKLKDPGTGKQIEINNYSRESEGFIDLRRATERSVNTYYVQLMQAVGPEKVAKTGKDLGITTKLSTVLSLGLGTVAVKPVELASAYATLANGGVRCDWYSIVKVTGPDGKNILANKPKCERAIEAGVVAQATQILRGVPDRGTGRLARIGRQSAGKTGTTDNYTDAWYAGYTPQLATAVWMGYPESNEHEMHNIQGVPDVAGGTLPAKIWGIYMRAAHKGLPVKSFASAPAGPSASVPDVVGISLDEAREKLKSARFYAIQLTAGATGIVIAQDPAAGTSVPAGSLITLKLKSERPTKPKPSPSPSASRKPSPSPSPSKSKSPTPSPSATSPRPSP